MSKRHRSPITFGFIVVVSFLLMVLVVGPVAAQQPGGTLTIAEWEREYPLNPHMRGGTQFQPQISPVLERLISFDPEGNPIPVLATEIPSFENGGLSEDGKTVTFHLRPGVSFADGEAMTCDDVRYTIEAVNNPDNIVTSRAGFDLVTSVDCPDELTAVLNYSEFYSAWMTIPWYVLPEHILSTEPNWNEHDWNLMPMGTGPFYVCENVVNEFYKWCKNEFYWQEGKPLLDEIIVLVVPDREALKARFLAGDYAMAYGLSELDLEEFAGIENAHLYLEDGAGIEELPLNFSPSTGPDMGKQGVPNPILGDLRVRQALQYATPKQEIVDTILGGFPAVAASHVPGGWGLNPDIPASEYDPDMARTLLEEAGWVDENGDGIREKDGERLHLTMMGSDAKYRLLYMQLIQQTWADVGVEMEIVLPNPSVRWAPYDQGGPVRRGAADVQAWGNAYELDATTGLNQFYRCDQVPSADNPTFWNVTRWCNEEFEQALDEAEASMDVEEKRAALRQAVQVMNDDLVTIPLFVRARISVFNTDMVGGFEPEFGPNGWEFPATYAADWYIP